MTWNYLTSEKQLIEAEEDSFKQPILIYKHSYRCGICSTALARLERSWPADGGPKAFFIDVNKDRAVSDMVAARYQVEHESPQALLIKNGKCILSRSHFAIDPGELAG